MGSGASSLDTSDGSGAKEYGFNRFLRTADNFFRLREERGACTRDKSSCSFSMSYTWLA